MSLLFFVFALHGVSPHQSFRLLSLFLLRLFFSFHLPSLSPATPLLLVLLLLLAFRSAASSGLPSRRHLPTKWLTQVWAVFSYV